MGLVLALASDPARTPGDSASGEEPCFTPLGLTTRGRRGAGDDGLDGSPEASVTGGVPSRWGPPASTAGKRTVDKGGWVAGDDPSNPATLATDMA